MSRFEELSWRSTPRGEISLRRRYDAVLGVDVYEAKLDEEFLMSSAFVVAEVELARLGLAEVSGDKLNVLVGGLGLGYTADAALACPRVASVTVVEVFEDVIGWHRDRLLPVSAELVGDRRTFLMHGDFFAHMAAGPSPELRDTYDAVLLDIDHTPDHLLHPDHAGFYTEAGLAALRQRLVPGGVFGLWSDDPPEPRFTELLGSVFDSAEARVVTFPNAYTGGESANTVYLARRS